MKLATAINEEDIAIDSHTEQPADESVLSSLGINGQLFLFQLINFAIVVVILWFLILKPLVKMLEERKKMVDESIDNAKKIENEVRETNRRFQEKMDEATVGANKIVAQAKEDAEKVSNDVKERSKEEIANMVAKAKQTIEGDRTAMLEEVKSDVADMVTDSVKAVLGDAVSDQVDRDWVNSQLKKINE